MALIRFCSLTTTCLNDNSSVFDPDPQPLKLDHCDLLLDALDAQLGQLQIKPQKRAESFRNHNHSDAAPLKWSESLSKDTGFGSTTRINDTPMSCLDLIHPSVMEQTSERSIGCWGDPDPHDGTKKRLSTRDRTRDKEEKEVEREQVIWRLEKLLGDTCKVDMMAGETHPPSESICTEDFTRCFREEMVEMAVIESTMHKQNKEEGGRTEISDSDKRQPEEKRQSFFNVERRGSATHRKTSKDTVTAHCSQSNKPGQRKELEKCPSGSFGVNMSHISEKALHSLGDDCSISHKTDVLREHENLQDNNSCSPKARCLAGVPVRSFDTVSVASNRHSVCIEQVRRHVHRWPGWRSLIQSVTVMDDYFANQSDYDTSTQEKSKPRSTSVHRSSYGTEQNISPFVYEAQHKNRENHRIVCPSGDNDTDEEINHWSRRCRSERTPEEMQSDWAKINEWLTNLQQKCEKQEETLRLRRTQLKDVELCLPELQQKRKHAPQELEGLTAKTAQMEKEKRTLESALSDSRVERDSISFQLEKLQRQRESCLYEIRDIEEELVNLRKRKKSLKDGSCMERNSVMSVLEREEMERQMESAKKELFAERCRAREKPESVQEKLEDTCEKFQRATEAESLLKNRCACLEETQIKKKEQTEALEIQVSKLQVELGESKIQVVTLEKILAQKEQQLLEFQEQRGALQAERDGLKVELQQVKAQHDKALKEAQEQAQRVMVNQQTEEKKAMALKEQTLALTRCIESMKSSIQCKEEEAKKLRKSLAQQREEAKKREEELHVEASEKVHKAIEEERGKWEAEKVEAIQMHCRILEEQNRKSLQSTRIEMQREKSKALALQQKVSELKTDFLYICKRVQELKRESCAQQREQESLLTVICKSLKEEHRAELQRSKKQMAQESQRTVLQLEQAVQLAEKETDRLRVMIEERESSHNKNTAELDQQLRHWAQELGAECQHLHLLVEESGAKRSTMQLPASPTVAEALKNLRALREQVQHFIGHLHQEIDSQKQTTEQLRKDKEQELSIQRQQLRMERDQALDSLKKCLIQEPNEEMSCLNRPHMSDGGAERGGVIVSLRKQLKAKDLELREVQRTLGQWKEQTAARLACKFQEELTAELERNTSNTRGERQRKYERREGGMTRSAKEGQNSVYSPSLHAVDSAASHSPSDVASFKLLHYLQGRVKQLCLENQTYIWSTSPPDSAPLDLSGSNLTTITQGQDSA